MCTCWSCNAYHIKEVVAYRGSAGQIKEETTEESADQCEPTGSSSQRKLHPRKRLASRLQHSREQMLQVIMPPLTVKLLVALTCFTAVYFTTEAADTCPVTTASCLPGLPGRDGRDGQPGHDGQPGRDGNDGATGPPGRDGRDGLPGLSSMAGTPGPQGSPGHNGTDGEQGPPGPQGPTGPSGPQGPTGPSGALNYTERQQLKEEILATVREEMSMLSCCNTSSSECERVATSCKELYQCNPAFPSGYYNITTPQGAERVYCDMNTANCGNITGGWMRAAYLDMTDESNTCPQGLTYTVVNSKRMCTHSHTGYTSCFSLTFPTHGVPYTKVCGRARGYHYYSAHAFRNYHDYRQTTLNSSYVSGLSVTYGSPQSHIWTFAAGLTKDYNYPSHNCPCAFPYPGPAAPPFVGENFFCETGTTGLNAAYWYLDDPLWDSQGCASGSTCCDRGGPWFTTTLSQEVSDDIEVRMCSYYPLDRENLGVDELEIYIY